MLYSNGERVWCTAGGKHWYDPDACLYGIGEVVETDKIDSSRWIESEK